MINGMPFSFYDNVGTLFKEESFGLASRQKNLLAINDLPLSLALWKPESMLRK
jgi:hypothetical protein